MSSHNAISPMFANETIVKLADGRSLRSGGERYQCGAYVRLVDRDGITELFYWDSAEWAEAPEQVMGAILSAATSHAGTHD